MPWCHCVAYSDQYQCWADILFNIKSIYVLCFHTYMYYKRTLVVSGFALARRLLEKIFRPTQNGFKYIYPQTVFKNLMFIILILYSSHLFYLTLFSTSRYSKLVSFMFYLVHSLSTWFTHSLISLLFRLGTTPTHPTRVELLSLLSD